MDRQIKVEEIFKLFWKKKFFIIVFSFFFSILSISYSLYLPNKYLSSVTLTMSEKSAGSSPWIISHHSMGLSPVLLELILAHLMVNLYWLKKLLLREILLRGLYLLKMFYQTWLQHQDIILIKIKLFIIKIYLTLLQKWVFKPAKGKKSSFLSRGS